MQWHSVNEFLAMGGYALYVWGSFGACLLAMIAEPLMLKHQHRQAVQALKRQRIADNVAMRWSSLKVEVEQ
ncbi:MAG TPA: heme exporter protein CcmD [Albitalea sp.]|nr:heme exporter protein CcmD [Albitalea sp.]